MRPPRRVFQARDSRQIVFGSILEEALLTQVLAWCRRAGWCAYHVRYSQGSVQGAHGPRSSTHDDASGWPDLVLVKPDGRLMFRELKTQRGRLDPNQRRWGEVLRSAGQDWDVWRPSDEQRIRAELGLP